MRSTLARRATTVAAAAALIAGGVGIGTAVAAPTVGLVPAAGTTTPATSATKTVDNISVTKSVEGNAALKPGDTVTYKTVFSVTSIVDRYVSAITDVAPAGFTYVPSSAKVTAYHVSGGMQTDPVTATVDPASGAVSVSNPGGWIVSKPLGGSAKQLTLEVSYTVPANATAGTFDSGVTFKVNTWTGTQSFNPMGVFVTVTVPTSPGGGTNSGGGTTPGGGTTGGTGSSGLPFGSS
ncbi:hypothetical protein [Speluncibacter jeojiensis]|uniref:DUF11 domain-containing protein n=1 Tax=Speluncibacter jeojiensis TaxID=2710754 RepID=A0A9X4RBU6_9ACTN|nr:hypothetical protein [Corynebacteriales bacterium D3-21]